MNPTEEQTSDEPTNSKKKQEVNDMPAKRQTMLDRIREVRENLPDGVKMLPVVRYERKLWFFDERLRQIRNVRNPHDFIDLDEIEMYYFKKRLL